MPSSVGPACVWVAWTTMSLWPIFGRPRSALILCAAVARSSVMPSARDSWYEAK